MKKILYLLLPILLTGSGLFAQQESQFTHFMYTKQFINPAYVGSKGFGDFLGLYRKQWIDFPGAPESQLLAYNAPFFDERVGFGLALSRHSTGDFEEYYGRLAYSYDLINSDELSLRAGIMGSLERYSYDFEKGTDVIYNPNDPVLSHISDEFPALYGNVGAGLYLNVKGAYVGFSVPNILSNQLGSANSPRPAQEEPHFYGMAGGIFPIPDSKISIYPNALFKYVQNAPYSLDLNLSFIYDNLFTLGASYRHGDNNGDSIDFLAHFQATRQFGVGLAYDLPVSDIRDYNNGSIEVMLSYNLSKKRLDLSNPRFFF